MINIYFKCINYYENICLVCFKNKTCQKNIVTLCKVLNICYNAYNISYQE